MVRKISIALAAVLVALITATVALAQSGPYAGEAGDVQERVSGRAGGGLGQLPFTGLDLAFIVGAGLLLVVVGVTLRRLNRRAA